MNDVLIFTHLLNGFLMVAMPIGLGILITRKFGMGWRLFWIGGLGFILSQVFHIPFNAVIDRLFNTGILPLPPQAWHPLFNAVFLGLSAGVFEEVTRYLIFSKLAKEARSWRKGLFLGVGHGGVEAIVLGILVIANYFVLFSVKDVDLSTLVPPDQLDLARQQVFSYWHLPWMDSLLGAVERLFTIPCQIAFSILVLQVFTRKQRHWLWLAIGWHALLDAVVVYAAQPLGMYATEGLIGLFALASIGIIFLLKSPEPPEIPQAVSGETETLPIQPFVPQDITVTAENLEQSRYD